MEKVLEFLKSNKKEIIMFISGFTICLLVFGSIMLFSNNKQTKKEEKNTVEKAKKSSNKKKKSNIEDYKIVENNTEENKNIENPTNNDIKEVDQSKEEDVVYYFEDVERRASGDENNTEQREQLKSDVAVIHDFLFENGTIKGKTFAELRNEIKLKILKITLSIDQKIDKYFPNYKERIKADYKDLKAMTITKYLETTNKICASNQQLCQSAREDFKTMKNSFKFNIILKSNEKRVVVKPLF